MNTLDHYGEGTPLDVQGRIPVQDRTQPARAAAAHFLREAGRLRPEGVLDDFDDAALEKAYHAVAEWLEEVEGVPDDDPDYSAMRPAGY